MYKKILVPLDGSELAEVALPYAEELAGKLDSEITLLYVSDLSRDNNSAEDPHQIYLQKIADAIKDNAARYSGKAKTGQAVDVKPVILTGNPADKIVNYADSENIGLIVMATHNYSGIKRWALGSVADRVIKTTTRPVEIIRAKGDQPDVRENTILNKVLVPLDGSNEGEAIIPYIEELASSLKIKVVLVQVLSSGYATVDNYIQLNEQQIESDKVTAAAYLDNIRVGLKEKGIDIADEAGSGIVIRFGNAAEEIIQLADKYRLTWWQ
jgi:nucleotide-binding universal stress UspA family protein